MGIFVENPLATAWLLTIVATAIAAALDVGTFTVPNWLTFPLCFLGLAYHTFLFGSTGFAFSTVGMLIGFLLLLLFFVVGAIGAGDVKLLAAVGAWLGPANTIWVCLFACIAAGFYSLGVIVAEGRLNRIALPFRPILRWCGAPVWRGAKMPTVEAASRGDGRRWRVLPFALMIAIAVLVLAVAEYQPLFLHQG